MKKSPTVSVVIPSYNEVSYIDRLLESLARQKFESFEVIVSDAHSNDGTAELVDSLKNHLDIRLVESPPKGPGAGRNEGAKLARGEWLLFLDADDDIDDPDFIKILFDETIKEGWNTSSAKFEVKNVNKRTQLALRANYKYLKRLARTKHPVAPGWCILTKRSTFEENNGFNEKIQFGEDYDYVSRVAVGGFGFVEKTHYFTDMRRTATDKWIGPKAVLNELYRHTHRYNLEKNPIKYEFGKHKTREQD